MKPSRIFWGVLFVAIGLLMLAGKTYDLDFGWDCIANFWPLSFVFIGLAVMLKNPLAKMILSALAAVGVALLLYGLLSFSWLERHFTDELEAEDLQVQEFSESFDSTCSRAVFSLDAAAGKYTIESTTSELFSASTKSMLGRYSLDKESSGDRVDLHLRMDGDVHINGWRLNKLKNRAEIRLNTTPVWDLDFDIGAANVNFDLSPYKVENIRIDAGAATVKLKLGSHVTETRVRINAGASTLRIAIPEDAGCQVRMDGALTSRTLDDFETVGDERYQTKNFETSKHKILIDIDSGVSNIRVTRY